MKWKNVWNTKTERQKPQISKEGVTFCFSGCNPIISWGLRRSCIVFVGLENTSDSMLSGGLVGIVNVRVNRWVDSTSDNKAVQELNTTCTVKGLESEFIVYYQESLGLNCQGNCCTKMVWSWLPVVSEMWSSGDGKYGIQRLTFLVYWKLKNLSERGNSERPSPGTEPPDRTITQWYCETLPIRPIDIAKVHTDFTWPLLSCHYTGVNE